MRLFLCLYLSNLLYCLIATLYKISIVDFSIFFSPRFSFHKRKINGINFILGWIPLGAHLRLLGMTENKEDQELFSQSELSHAFFTKPRYVRIIFKGVPYFVFLLSFFISFLLLDNFSNISGGLTSLLEYIKIGFLKIISNNYKEIDFAVLTNELRNGHNIVLFSFMLMTFIMLLLSPVPNILDWFSNGKKSTLKKILGPPIIILMMWFYIWDLPKFIFSFHTTTQNAFYFLSFLLGMFLSGLCFYFITIFFAKYLVRDRSQTW